MQHAEMAAGARYTKIVKFLVSYIKYL